MNAVTLFASIGICLTTYLALRGPIHQDASDALRAFLKKDERIYFGILACVAVLQALASFSPDFLGKDAPPVAHWAVSIALIGIVALVTYVRLMDMVRQLRAKWA